MTLKFNTDFNPTKGKLVDIAPNISRIVAPNASAFTFSGTNCFFVGKKELFIIDPGPNDDAHLAALITAIDGRRVKAILLTHTHIDHSAIAKRLSETVNAPIWFEGKHRLSRPKKLFEVNLLKNACDWGLEPDRALNDGDILKVDEVRLRVITTSGHCANHISFGVVNSPYIFSGDHVMGWNSTLIATPDGSLGDYFNSLDKLIDGEWGHFFPAHGSEIEQGKIYAKALKAHREKRNAQILAAFSSKYLRAEQLLDIIYPHHKGRKRFAARLTLKAHLEFLLDEGKINSRLSFKGWLYYKNF